MNFNELETDKKEKLHQMILKAAMSVGGKNFFLKMIEDIKKETKHPLLNKSMAFRWTMGRMSWNKPVYKDTLILLFEGMKNEEKNGSILASLAPRKHKTTSNMMRALKPLKFTAMPKNQKEGEGFSFAVFDVIEGENTKVSDMFKTIFFYNIDFAKKALSYEEKQNER